MRRYIYRPIDTTGLPPELIKQLKTNIPRDGIKGTVHNLIPDVGIFGINEMLVAYYHKTGEVMKRDQMNGVLYQLEKAGFLEKGKSKGTWVKK